MNINEAANFTAKTGKVAKEGDTPIHLLRAAKEKSKEDKPVIVPAKPAAGLGLSQAVQNLQTGQPSGGVVIPPKRGAPVPEMTADKYNLENALRESNEGRTVPGITGNPKLEKISKQTESEQLLKAVNPSMLAPNAQARRPILDLSAQEPGREALQKELNKPPAPFKPEPAKGVTPFDTALDASGPPKGSFEETQQQATGLAKTFRAMARESIAEPPGSPAAKEGEQANMIADILDAVGVGLSAYGGVNRQTMRQKQREAELGTKQRQREIEMQTAAQMGLQKSQGEITGGLQKQQTDADMANFASRLSLEEQSKWRMLPYEQQRLIFEQISKETPEQKALRIARGGK